MTQSISDHLERFYSLLAQLADLPDQGCSLRELNSRSSLPHRGVYFFHEAGECRASNPNTQRFVRVGTHAVSSGSKSSLYKRLKTHFGTRSGGGNHRGSIFRLHVGNALLAREGLSLPTWGVGSSAPPAVRNDDDARVAEAECEKRVSEYIGSMPVWWINIPDEAGPYSARAYIERNTIALLSNQLDPVDSASPGWLGSFSPRPEIRSSALWNLNYVEGLYEPAYLDVLESFVILTCKEGSRLSSR